MHRCEGFSLVDMLVTIAVIGILAGVATPRLQDFASAIRLGQGQREVERELQTARLKAVTANRAVRVRFNCPVVGQYRMVELVGTPRNPDAIDDAPDRCSATKYTYPAADMNPLTVPNHDGPVRLLPRDIAFGAAVDLEFWPDGSAHQRSGTTNPWPVVVPTGTAVTVTKGTQVKRITVNGLGKITLVQ